MNGRKHDSNSSTESNSSKLKIDLHKKAEFYESRINDVIDGYQNIHPSKSAEMAIKIPIPTNKKQSMTYEEKLRFNNYKQTVPQTKIPLFWEPRPWDKEEDKMTEEENRDIMFRVYTLNKVPSKSSFTFHNRTDTPICPHFDDISSPNSSHQEVHSIRLSIKDHLTDDYDTDTDTL